MKKKSYKVNTCDSNVPNQTDITQIDSEAETLKLQEIVGEFCEALVTFYGKLRSFQMQIPKILHR